MKMLSISNPKNDQLSPSTLYDLTADMFGMYMAKLNDHEIYVCIDDFQPPSEMFKMLLPKVNKAIIITPTQGQTVDLLLTENYFIVYAHTKGNHWNVWGNHYKYFHDINTGEFIPDSHLPISAFKEKTIIKERLVKKVAQKLNSLITPKACTNEN